MTCICNPYAELSAERDPSCPVCRPRPEKAVSPSIAPVSASDVGKSGVQPHGLSLEAVRELVDRIQADAERIAQLERVLREAQSLLRRGLGQVTALRIALGGSRPSVFEGDIVEFAPIMAAALSAPDEASIQSRVLSDQPTKDAQGKQERSR